MGYHLTEIERGEYGEFSKIREEFLEAEDAIEQGNKLMLLVELADLIGAIEGYCTKHNMTIRNDKQEVKVIDENGDEKIFIR